MGLSRLFPQPKYGFVCDELSDREADPKHGIDEE
jgi:hypothetical protein